MTTIHIFNITSKDPKLPQMTSNDLKRPQLISESTPEVKLGKNKIKLKDSGNIEINVENLDETLQDKII